MFEKALQEIRKLFVVVDSVHIIANSFIIFLICVFFLILFRFSWEWAFLPFILALGYFGYVDFSKNKLLVVEENVPELSEKLRAAADNIHRKNWITDSLKISVLRKMGDVKASYFLDFRRLSAKLFTIFILSFFVIAVSFFNINFDFGSFIVNIAPVSDKIEWAGSVGAEDLIYTSGNLSDILGEPSLARLGSEELKMEMGQIASEIDIRDIRAVEDNDFTRAEFPKEIYTAYEEAYVDRVSVENQEIVKNYFAELNV